MANPYTAVTISGYNATPPPDDGSQVSANQVTWAKHKTKLADPIKTLAESINTNVNAAFATVDDASNLSTGTLPDGRFPATLPAASGANLTALNATNLASGTVPDARFPATLPAISGANLTNLNGTNIASGTVADARLSANVPLIDAQNNFSGLVDSARSQVATNTSTGTSAYQTIRARNDATRETYIYRTGSNFSGSFATGGPTGESGGLFSTGNFPLSLVTNDNERLGINGSGNFDFHAGTVTTTGASAAEVGTHGLPQNSQSGAYTFVLADRNKHLYLPPASSGDITVPANASVAFPVGTTLTILNRSGSSRTLAITSDTMVLAGTDTTGSRTLIQGALVTLMKYDTTTWVVSGSGLE